VNRKDQLDKALSSGKIWDIAVIGGGSSGFGVMLDALSRGLSVVLLERGDFGQGTSSRSTKLLHGGVRYLAKADVKLVFEAIRERGELLRNARHLARVQAFVIPVYSRLQAVWYTLGLKFYDLLAGTRSLGKSRYLNKAETLRRMPMLRPDRLRGGVLYHDGQFDDARLIISLADNCSAMGGVVLNYCHVHALQKDTSGKVNGLAFLDLETDAMHTISARMVVNAAGVFTDEISQMDLKQTTPTVVASQGSHLVLPASVLASEYALLIPETSDGRVLFAVPWQGKVVVGTTDVPVVTADVEPKISDAEVSFIISTAQRYFNKPILRSDVLSVFSGLRPLAAPAYPGARTKEISRSHKVIVAPSGLVSITGGKWTTFRKMGQDTVDYFTKVTGLPTSRSRSVTMNLAGEQPANAHGKYAQYGSKARAVDAFAQANPQWNVPLHPDYEYTEAQVIWAVRYEMALHLDDVLSRRLRLLMLDAEAARTVAPAVAGLMANEFGHGDEWVRRELDAFYTLLERYTLAP
jgi:glycerol-3-phosphate dehydrogenase